MNMHSLMPFRENHNFKKRILTCVCGVADVPLTLCRRTADFPLTLPQTLSRQEALQTVKYNRGDVQDLDPQNAPQSHQKGSSQFSSTSQEIGEQCNYDSASTL
jgi:hypothetical protein